MTGRPSAENVRRLVVAQVDRSRSRNQLKLLHIAYDCERLLVHKRRTCGSSKAMLTSCPGQHPHGCGEDDDRRH